MFQNDYLNKITSQVFTCNNQMRDPLYKPLTEPKTYTMLSIILHPTMWELPKCEKIEPMFGGMQSHPSSWDLPKCEKFNPLYGGRQPNQSTWETTKFTTAPMSGMISAMPDLPQHPTLWT